MLYKDQLGRTIELEKPPVRIVSLVPSQTELLAHLGLEPYIAGITKFCIHPDRLFRSKPHIGGTKNLNIEKIKSLAPDLIIGNKEENEKHQMEELMQWFPVWMSDIKNLEDALDMIIKTGELTQTLSTAGQLKNEIREAFKNHPVLPAPGSMERTAVYLIWNDPFMTVNKDTFIHDMMGRAGFINVFAGKEERYPTVSLDEIKNKNPAYLLLSSEPFPFGQKHVRSIQHEFSSSRVLLADGEMFSWYGSRLLKAAAYLQSISKE